MSHVPGVLVMWCGNREWPRGGCDQYSPLFSSLLFSSVLNESDARCAQLRCAHMLSYKKNNLKNLHRWWTFTAPSRILMACRETKDTVVWPQHNFCPSWWWWCISIAFWNSVYGSEFINVLLVVSMCCSQFFFPPLPAAELETSPPVSRLMNAAARAASFFMYPSMCSLDHILERRGEKNKCISGRKRIWGMIFFIISAHTSQ